MGYYVNTQATIGSGEKPHAAVKSTCFQSLQTSALENADYCVSRLPDMHYGTPLEQKQIEEKLGKGITYHLIEALSDAYYPAGGIPPSSIVKSAEDFQKWFDLGCKIFGWNIPTEAISNPEILYRDFPLTFELSDTICRAYLEYTWYRSPVENLPAVKLFNKIREDLPKNVRDNYKHPSFWLALYYSFRKCANPISGRAPFVDFDITGGPGSFWFGMASLGGRESYNRYAIEQNTHANLLLVKSFADSMISQKYTGNTIYQMARKNCGIGFSELVSEHECLSPYRKKGGYAVWVPIDELPKMWVRSLFKKDIQDIVNLLPSKENPGVGVPKEDQLLRTVLTVP